jgi:glycerate 2-kinase
MVDLKQLARRIFTQTLAAIDVPQAMQRKLVRRGSVLSCADAGSAFAVDLRAFERVCFVAIGKAALGMVEGLVAVLGGDMALEGVVAAPSLPEGGHGTAGLKYFAAGHPLPDAGSWWAAEAALELLRGCDERSLVFFLLSGGGSALLERPLDSRVTLADVQELYRALVTCGAAIGEIGVVRRHVSAVKGGRLAVAAGRATKITLAVSDVPVGQEAALASGPALPDPSTIADALDVLRKYALEERLPVSLREWIDTGKMPETPKAGDAAFTDANFALLLGMDDLFHPAHRAAEAAGCITCCDNCTDDWPVDLAAEYLLEQLAELSVTHPGRRVALIADGEVSSPVTGDGVGGRNSSFVLACVEKIAGRQVAVLSAGTDGIDGNSPAAGAVADGETLERARAAGLDAREFFGRSDAYGFFSRLDDAVVTGPTGNNLRDLRVLVAEPQN